MAMIPFDMVAGRILRAPISSAGVGRRVSVCRMNSITDAKVTRLKTDSYCCAVRKA